MLKKWVCLATLIFCCIFSCQGKGICFSLHYFPVACLTKTTLLLIMTRGSYLLLPLELQQQKAFKTMVSVMTIKLKRLEFKNSNCGECQVRYSEEDISVEYGSPAAWANFWLDDPCGSLPAQKIHDSDLELPWDAAKKWRASHIASQSDTSLLTARSG